MKLDLPIHDPQARTAAPKPVAGEHWQDRKQVTRDRKAHEREQMEQARRRDMAACHGCRWPGCEFASRKPRLEVSHCFTHRGAGGNPDGTRTVRDQLLLVCFIHHRRIDTGDAEVQPLTDRGTDGLLSFHERNQETGRMEHVASERAIGISESRTA